MPTLRFVEETNQFVMHFEEDQIVHALLLYAEDVGMEMPPKESWKIKDFSVKHRGMELVTE